MDANDAAALGLVDQVLQKPTAKGELRTSSASIAGSFLRSASPAFARYGGRTSAPRARSPSASSKVTAVEARRTR